MLKKAFEVVFFMFFLFWLPDTFVIFFIKFNINVSLQYVISFVYNF